MSEKVPTLAVLASVVAVPVILAWYGLAYRPSTYPAKAQVVNLTGIARRGVWTLERVNNLNYWWKSFEPATLQLPLHSHVVLRLHSADVVHQFYVPELRIGPVNVEPGHVTELDLLADQEGVFQYFCTSLCGECHFYMSGWIVVTAPGKPVPHPKPISCPLCLPEAPPPADQGIVAQGEYLYRQKACGACHGLEGRGGVANYNYLNGEIVDHVHLATRLFLRNEHSAEALVDWLSRQEEFQVAGEVPKVAGFGIVKARLEAAHLLIRDGKNAAKADLDGPEPPLQMPAWKNKLTEQEIFSILAYLITLNPWDEEETEEQPHLALTPTQ
jgi:mono/diheme cytochrome c family protein